MPPLCRCPWLWTLKVTSLVALLFSASVSAGVSNRTIDDTNGDSVTGALPSYSTSWNVGQTCPGCRVQPSPGGCFDDTWHDTTSDSGTNDTHSVSLSFQGTAIWVFCVLVNTGEPYITIYSNISFELDGAPVGGFSHTPNPNATQYLYNQTVFSKTGLSNTDHTLVIAAVQGSAASLLLFDWAMYTFDDSPATTTPTQRTPSQTPTLSLPSTLSVSRSGTASGSSGPITGGGSGADTPTGGNTSKSKSGLQTTTAKSVSTGHQSGNSGSRTGSVVTTSAGPTTTGTGLLSSGSHGAPVGAIAGAVLSGVAILALLVCLAIYCRRRRRRAPRRVTPAVHREPKPTAPLLDRRSSVPSAVLISNISSATPSSTAVVTDALAPVALSMDKEMGSDDYAASENNELAREAEDLRRRVARLRAASDLEPSPVEPMQAPESTDISPMKDVPWAPTTSRPTTSRPATRTADSLHMEFENEALRRELGLLRREMARLQAGITADEWGPPPAYASA